MVRPTRAFVAILSAVALPLLAVLVLLPTSVRLYGGFGSMASLRKCKDMRKHLQKLPFSLFA